MEKVALVDKDHLTQVHHVKKSLPINAKIYRIQFGKILNANAVPDLLKSDFNVCVMEHKLEIYAISVHISLIPIG